MGILRKGVIEAKRFSELSQGELFAFSQTNRGPYVKISPSTYTAWISEPIQANIFRIPMSFAATMTGRNQYGFRPPVTIDPATIIYNAYSRLPPQWFNGSTPSGPAGFQGNDPVLPPPYPPIDYQLFVIPLSETDFPRVASGSCGAPPGQCATLYWTLPDVSALNYRIYNTTSHNVYYWKRNNATIGGSPTLILPGGIATESLTLPTLYLWFKNNTPSPTPLSSALTIGPTSPFGNQTWPVGIPQNIMWTGAAPLLFKGVDIGNTITTFKLERAVNNSVFTVIEGSIDSSWISGVQWPNVETGRLTYAIPDYGERILGNNYFYRLTGYTANPPYNTTGFPYNVVALISPYTITAVTNASGTTLTWTSPLTADVANWPTG